jgi:hypothetical protein
VAKGRVVDVQCQCGQALFQYYKGGRGRLIKCFLDEVRQDRLGLHGLATASRPACPACGGEIGIVRLVRGRPALKLSQGTVKPVRT